MAPPRRILRQQLEILMDFLEENKDMSGAPTGSTVSHQVNRQKWAVLAKKINAVESGALKTPEGWKKYWFEWRHKCRRKAANTRRFQSAPDGGSSRFVPLNDLEVRALVLCGKGSVTAPESSSKQLESFLAEDSDSEPLENVKARSMPVGKPRRSLNSVPKATIPTDTAIISDEEQRSVTPPPKWALDIEERRLAVEERMAAAMESIASVLSSQEERRARLDERLADAVTAIAGTVQDLNSGVQEALQQLQQMHPAHSNGPDVKGHFIL